MNVLIVLAHPEVNSFNAALARQAEKIFSSQGCSTRISDLYSNEFDPSEHARHFAHRANPERFFPQTEQRYNGEQKTLPSDVQAELDAISWADFVLLQFPLWWFGMPAVLKGWMDRVFAYGTLYSGQQRFNNGVCRGKRAMLSVTAGSSHEACSFNGREGDTNLMLWPIHYALHYVGFTVIEPIILTSIGQAHGLTDPAAHEKMLRSQLERHAEDLLDLKDRPVIPFNAEDDWDDRRKLKPGAPVYSPFIRHTKDLNPWGCRSL